jgi:hypothetical protein
VDIHGILLSRCPRCRQGPIFTSDLVGLVGGMNESCPNCSLRFLRESGFFIGAMYVSYGLGVLTILPVAVVMAVVLHWSLAVVLILSLLQTVISIPIFLRYSRVLWLYMDQTIDPR